MKKILLAAYLVALSQGSPAIGDVIDGLVAYYPFSGDTSDYSGNGNDGVPHGCSPVMDRFGEESSAYTFDGQNDYIEVPRSDTLDTRYSISIFAWVNSLGDAGPIVNYATDRYGVHLYETMNNAPDELFSRIVRRGYGFTSSIEVSGLVTPGWKFVGVTYDYASGLTQLWLNGKEVGSINIGTTEIATQDNVRIGLRDGDERIFYGDIDDIRIYNRALSDGEIVQLFGENGWIRCDINDDGKYSLQDLGFFFRECRRGSGTWYCDREPDDVFNALDLLAFYKQCR